MSWLKKKCCCGGPVDCEDVDVTAWPSSILLTFDYRRAVADYFTGSPVVTDYGVQTASFTVPLLQAGTSGPSLIAYYGTDFGGSAPGDDTFGVLLEYICTFGDPIPQVRLDISYPLPATTTNHAFFTFLIEHARVLPMLSPAGSYYPTKLGDFTGVPVTIQPQGLTSLPAQPSLAITFPASKPTSAGSARYVAVIKVGNVTIS